MTSPADRLTNRWEAAGARVTDAVAGAHAVLVTGRDAEAAAHAAIGLGRAESARRRVAIGDLVGDVPPLVALVESDDVHGVVDSFLYGVSLNRVAQPVTGSDSLFVLPSGTEPVVTEEIFRSERWRRLASGFREMGALLLLVAPADAPGLDMLAGMLDGVVSVGDESGEIGHRFPVLASVSTREPRPEPAAEEPTGERRSRPRGTRAGGSRARVVLPPAEPAPSRRRWVVPLVVLLLALAGGAAAAFWLRERNRQAARPAPARRDTVVAATPAVPPPAAPDTLAMQLVPTNPGDSAAATAYAIELAKVSSEEGARMSVQEVTGLPVTTWFPVRLGNDPDVRWYRVVGGSWSTRAGADSALAALAAGRTLELPASVLRAPLALLVGSALGADSLRARTARYTQAGVAVYALRQADGTHNLYAGAFETPDQSMFLALALQQMGDVPTLAYRTGRAP